MPRSFAFEAELLTQLRELHAALHKHNIRYCVIGGVAANAHGNVRATHDLDLMLRIEDAPAALELVTGLGYEVLDPGQEIASYVRAHTRLDILFAQRPITRELLERAETVDFAGSPIAVIPVEGLIGLKIQAFSDNPIRIKDLEDIINLVRLHREDLNIDEVRAYFRLFGREAVLDDILKSTRSIGADSPEASG